MKWPEAYERASRDLEAAERDKVVPLVQVPLTTMMYFAAYHDDPVVQQTARAMVVQHYEGGAGCSG